MAHATGSGARRASRVWLTVAVATAAVLAAALPASAATQPPGVGKPPPGTGMGTSAAFANPLCDKAEGPYGKLDFVIKGGAPDTGGGPVCVAVWKGSNNGGATYQGVTKDSVKIIALLPNPQQAASTPVKPMNNATGQPGTLKAAFDDALPAYTHVFETYGRKIDLEYVVSTGDDETAQRADAVTVIAERPFAVFDANMSSHPAFETQVAGAKIPVFGPGASLEATQKQAPYRWGQADLNSAAVNAAEYAGKQLAGKKAQYAGDAAMHSKTRKLGVVSSDTVDRGLFDQALAKYGAKIDRADTITYPASGSITGDPAVAQETAPTAIAKLKASGVTTVMLLSDSAMITALTKQATLQDYHPEWIISAYNYSDLTIIARGYDQTQWAHAFGISNLPPLSATLTNSATASVDDPVQWYWGKGKGTTGTTAFEGLQWAMSGIMYAGPKLTPKTFQQGFFAVPAAGGAASHETSTVQHGYGRTPGLPYLEYLRGNQDFTVVWWDPTTASSSFGLPPAPGTLWYVDAGKRYSAGTWPTKAVTPFDKSNSITQPPAGSGQRLIPVPCRGCPSETGKGSPPAD